LGILLLLTTSCSVISEFRSDMADKLYGRESADAPMALAEIKPAYNLTINWQKNLGEASDYDLSPALSAGIIYTSNVNGDLFKLDATNGKEIWRKNVNEAISGGTEFAGGLVLVGTKKGSLIALDIDGKVLWKSFLSSELLSAPRYYQGVVVARTVDNRIFGIDAADGSRKWIYERTAPALSLRNSAGVVIDGGAVYAGFSGGKLVAIRADNGKLIWETTVASPKGVTEIERIADITSLPYVDGPLVYAVAFQGKIAAIDRKTGRPVWDREISSYSGLSAESGKIYVSHALGSVYALDYTNGRSFWRQGDLINRKLTAPLSMGAFVVVGDLEGYLHVLSREDGSFVGRIKLDDSPISSIVNGNNNSQLLATDKGGKLFAVTIK
jgi:outer membrane protein assembly factor BamB